MFKKTIQIIKQNPGGIVLIIMSVFTIKDLENLSGIKAHTIRIWEQRYSFLKPNRTGTNIRFYNSEELKAILNISLLNKYGFKISHIDRMNDEEVKEKILSLSHNEAQQQRIVNELIHHMVDLNIESFEDVIDNYVNTRGIEKAITHIIFPFLERIGMLWLTNHIIAGQEHLVTNVIRQKLIVGIENTISYVKINKCALLFLPEGEHHELGLLFINYILKSRGVKILYLGASVPVSDIGYIAKHKKPDLLFTHITAVTQNFNMEKFFAKLHSAIPSLPVIVSGQFTRIYKKKTPANIYLKKSLAEVLEHMMMPIP